MFLITILSSGPSSYYSYYLDPSLTTLKNDNHNDLYLPNTTSSLPPPSVDSVQATTNHLENDITDKGSTTIDTTRPWLPSMNNSTKVATSDGISQNLPRWMRDYMLWHRQRRQELVLHHKSSKEEDAWKEQPLLIVRCLEHDRCGGTSDRLKSLPIFVLLAAKTNRLLLLRWTRPFRLEEFLRPGPALNLSVPVELERLLNNDSERNNNNNVPYFEGKHVQKLIAAASSSDHWLVEGNIQYSGGKLYTNLVVPHQQSKGLPVEDWDYTAYYHDFFPSVFVPAPTIQTLWQNFQRDWNLIPNQYTVAHYRAKYPNEPYLESGKNASILEETIVNAVHCAAAAGRGTSSALSSSSSSSPVTVYVASDTALALELAQRYFSNDNNNTIRVVSHLNLLSPTTTTTYNHSSSSSGGGVLEDPPHLNFAQKQNPDAFFSIFIDLWAMSQSRCVSFGAGGFGRFGSLVSHNMSCRVAHSIKGQLQTCG
jgi:hypothetical protein